MKRCILPIWILLLISGLAFAQVPDLSGTGQPTSGDNAKNSLLTNLATVNLFVDGALGADTNSCTASGATACLTIQAAINKVPKRMQKTVTITVAAGDYAGAYIYNFLQEGNATAANGAVFQIIGTMTAATLASGINTGTLTSFAGGSQQVFDVITVAGGGWTVNNLRGFLFVATGGTGSGQQGIIVSNTATTITVARVHQPNLDNTTTFAIRDWGTIINAAVALPAGANTGSIANAGGLLVAGSSSTSRNDGNFSIQQIKFSNAISVGIRTDAQTSIRYCNFNTAGTGALGAIRSFMSPRLEIDDNYFLIPASGRGVAISNSNQSPMYVTSSRNVYDSGAIGLDLGSVLYTSTADFWRNQSTAALRLENIFQGTIQENRIDCNSVGGSNGILWQGNTTNKGTGLLTLLSIDVSNCVTAFSITGPALFVTTSGSGGVTGSNNTAGINVAEGGRFITNTGYALVAMTDITIEGLNYTLVQLRAQTPKSILDTISGARVYEQ